VGRNAGAAKCLVLNICLSFSMVDDPATNDLICWSKDGETFLVPNHVRFGDEVLPRFFKHNRFSSFVRQLNMYGFHKVPHLQQGALKADVGQESELWEFKNDNFKRDRPELLLNMQRKKGVRSEEEVVKGKGRDSELNREGTAPLDDVTGALTRTQRNEKEAGIMQLASVWSAIQSIQSAQQGINDNLRHLHNSQSELFREAAEQRTRTQKQEETINKMLRFLASVFGAQDIGGGKGGAQGGNAAAGSTDGRRRRVVVRPTFSKNKSGRLMIGDMSRPEEGDQIEELEVPMDDEEGEGIANIEELPAMSRSNSNSPQGGTTPQSRFGSTNSPVTAVQDLPSISEVAPSPGGAKHMSPQTGSQIANALSNGEGSAWLANLFGQQANQQAQHNDHSFTSSPLSDKNASSGGGFKLDAQTLATLQSVLGNMSDDAPGNQLARNNQNLQGSGQDAAMVQNALNSLLEGLRMENGALPAAPQAAPEAKKDDSNAPVPSSFSSTEGNDGDMDQLLKEFLNSGASTGSSAELTPTAMDNAFINDGGLEGQTPEFAFSPTINGVNHDDDVAPLEEKDSRRSSSSTSIDPNSTTSTPGRASSPSGPSRKRKPAALESPLGDKDVTEVNVKAVKNPRRAHVS
jgi:hypothetical protein